MSESYAGKNHSSYQMHHFICAWGVECLADTVTFSVKMLIRKSYWSCLFPLGHQIHCTNMLKKMLRRKTNWNNWKSIAIDTHTLILHSELSENGLIILHFYCDVRDQQWCQKWNDVIVFITISGNSNICYVIPFSFHYSFWDVPIASYYFSPSLSIVPLCFHVLAPGTSLKMSLISHQ